MSNLVGDEAQTLRSEQQTPIKQRPRIRLCRSAGWRPLGAGAKRLGGQQLTCAEAHPWQQVMQHEQPVMLNGVMKVLPVRTQELAIEDEGDAVFVVRVFAQRLHLP